MMAGFAAGPHYDPAGTKSHKGPKGGGHKGDLPVLNASEKGISQTVTAPQLKLADVRAFHQEFYGALSARERRRRRPHRLRRGPQGLARV